MLTSIEQLEENIVKSRHDRAMSEKQFEHAINLSNTQFKADIVKIIISLIVGAAACVGAGVALATYVEHHQTPAPVQQTEGRP